MSFADVETTKTEFKKTTYLDLTPGKHLIRVLDDNATKVFVHYINRSTVLCLDDDCPICTRNKQIMTSNPDNYREIKGWAARSRRYFVNVLDRTAVKVCPNCGTENKKMPNNAYAPSCYKCNNFITGVEETKSNSVKLWGFGVEMGEQLNSIEATILDEDENPLSLTSYDLVLNVVGAGKERKINAVAMQKNTDVVTVEPDAKYNASSAVITLHPDEMLQLQAGVSLKDIFAARKAQRAYETSDAYESELKEANQELVDKIGQMFA